MKKYNRIWMIIMSMLLLFFQPITVSATEPFAEQESETEENEGDLQDEEESGSPEADGQEGEDADEDEVEEDPKKPYVNHDTTGRNDLCPCGSGKKYKKCCGKE